MATSPDISRKYGLSAVPISYLEIPKDLRHLAEPSLWSTFRNLSTDFSYNKITVSGGRWISTIGIEGVRGFYDLRGPLDMFSYSFVVSQDYQVRFFDHLKTQQDRPLRSRWEVLGQAQIESTPRGEVLSFFAI
jgi:hypothetical protein